MPDPSVHDCLNKLAEVYGLPKLRLVEILRTPLNPAKLRDEFAGKALQALIGTPAGRFQEGVFALNADGGISLSRTAYRFADQMLEARNA